MPFPSRSDRTRLLARCSLIALAAPVAHAQPYTQAQPMPATPIAPIASPKDTPYPGTISLKIDATDLDRHIFTAHETIPVTGAGDHVLLFPKWLPGDHSPTGELDKFASLMIHAGGAAGQPLAWVRDPFNVYACHVPVPAGASALDLDFQYLSPTEPKEGRVVMTPTMLSLQWNNILLYPAGYFSRHIKVDAQAILPAGWQQASALDVAGIDGGTVRYKTTTLNTLVDSPVLAGRYFRREDLSPGGPAPVHLDIVADSPDELAITPVQLDAHRNVVTQAYRLFQSHHYPHYDFLLSISDELGDIGLEHHASSEDGVGRGYFTEWDKTVADRDLLPHEYTHSWNGKFRRPADLWQPNFNVPEGDSLLWVYEGQTEYWGKILATRSGLNSKQDALDSLALTAATYSNGIGRTWRDLEDTTNDPIIAQRRPIPWRSWQRSEDYYEEGLLVWLDVDTTLRAMSHGTKSLDDFAHAFFGVDNGSEITKTYVFDDVVHALNDLQPYDWAGFLHQLLYATGPVAPLDGITNGGYKLVFSDVISPYQKSEQTTRHITDYSFSLGLTLAKGGMVRGAIWNSPAFTAGIVAGAQIVAVNGLGYDDDVLKQAVIDAKPSGSPAIELLIKAGDRYRTVKLDYHQGLRYPHLVRTSSGNAPLDAILAPRE